MTPASLQHTLVSQNAASGKPHQAAETFNIASHLPRLAESAKDRRAVVVSERREEAMEYRSVTFGELEALSNRYANGLVSAGIERGHRVLLMVRPGFEFVGLVFALFKIGAVPVMIDPGMGVNRLLDCIRTVALDGFVGIPLAQIVRVVRPGSFRGVRMFVTVGRRWFWGGVTLDEVSRGASDRFDLVKTTWDETAAILFTSGSTGPAKGVVYEHGMFEAQVRRIQSCYGIESGETDLPTFPLFALFSVAMGMTIVLPDMDPSHPARVNPANIVDVIRDQKVTNTFGSPAVWKRVAAYCVERGITLPSLRRILIAGAPVPRDVIEQLHAVLSPVADVHTPYGATESLPVATISGREILETSRELQFARPGEANSLRATQLPRPGFSASGTCVGRPLPGVAVRLIRVTDEPIADWSDDLVVRDGEVGEICVRGPAVTKEYFGLPKANALAKIKDGDTVWHRIGDVGYRDADGRLWFCGRKAHRVTTRDGTLFTECVEPIFNEHPDVSCCALVGVGPKDDQRPVLIVEPVPGCFPRAGRIRSFSNELLDFVHAAEQISSSTVMERSTNPEVQATDPISTAAGLERSSEPRPQATDQVTHATAKNAVVDGTHVEDTTKEERNASPLTKGGQWGVAVPLRASVPSCLRASQLTILQSAIGNRQLSILFHRSFPVDIRHNAKINREQLADWAARRLR